MTGRLTMECGLEQAQAVSDALDLRTRLSLGQIGEIATLVTMGEINVRDDGAPGGHRRADPSEAEEIADLCERVARVLGHRPGSGFGVGAAGVGPTARRCYEIQKTIDRELANERDPGGRTVKHDGLGPRYTMDEAPRARIVREGEGR